MKQLLQTILTSRSRNARIFRDISPAPAQSVTPFRRPLRVRSPYIKPLCLAFETRVVNSDVVRVCKVYAVVLDKYGLASTFTKRVLSTLKYVLTTYRKSWGTLTHMTHKEGLIALI